MRHCISGAVGETYKVQTWSLELLEGPFMSGLWTDIKGRSPYNGQGSYCKLYLHVSYISEACFYESHR
jgi:hypothetical protein